MSNRIVIGVDVGGTFTDILALDEASGKVNVAKVPSTRGDQSAGFLEGIKKVTNHLADIGTIIHGTTVATNALLERKGAKTGIITTKGFRDVLEMRRRDRPSTWGLWGQFTPVVDRACRLEVDERTGADGTIRQAVNEDQVKAAAKAFGGYVGADDMVMWILSGGDTSATDQSDTNNAQQKSQPRVKDTSVSITSSTKSPSPKPKTGN